MAASYPNGDRLKVEFREFSNAAAFDKRYPTSTPKPPEWLPPDLRDSIPERPPEKHSDRLVGLGGSFPVTTVEVEMEVAGTAISFGPRETRIGGVTMTGCWAAHCGTGIQLG